MSRLGCPEETVSKSKGVNAGRGTSLTAEHVFDLGVFDAPGICKQRRGHELF